MRRSGVAVVFFAAQYGGQIGKFIRQRGVWTETVMPGQQDTLLRKGYFGNALGIVYSGSRFSVYSPNAPLPSAELLELPIPQLGNCYGQQAMQHVLGGEVIKGEKGEFGVSELHITDKSDLFRGLRNREQVLMSHRDVVVRPATGHTVIGHTENSPYAALRDLKGRLFGVQFHPEVYQTPRGREMVRNFLNVCHAKRDWRPGDQVEEKINRIREEAGKNYVVVLTSGGGDSTAASLMTKRALPPDQVCYLLVKTGLERKNDTENAERMLRVLGIQNLYVMDESPTTFKRLEGVTNDSEIRTIVGDVIFEARDKLAAKLGLRPGWKTGQGSLYTDLIESATITGLEAQIKIHHNANARSLGERAAGMLIEPLNDCYKDDSHSLGRRLGVPEKVIRGEPYPGPGMSVRMLSLPHNFSYNLAMLEQLDSRANEISSPYGFESYVRPYYTVGVQGDERTTVHPVVLEGDLDKKAFKELTPQLPNKINLISRVWFLLDPGEVGRMEVIRGTWVSPDRVRKLQEYDYFVKKAVRKLGFRGYTQFPVYLVSDTVDDSGEMVVLRPFFALDYMTGVPVWMPPRIREAAVNAIHVVDDKLGLKKSAVGVETGGKPPGTVEII